MRYFNPQEIKKINRTELQNSLKRHLGKNLEDSFAAELVSHYAAKLNLGRGCKVLDLGTASGAFASQMWSNNYHNIYGVDIDDYLTEGNRSLFIEFKTADLSFDPIPWPDNFFNIATAWCVLPHLENPFHCIREAHRVLASNGLLIFTVPNLSSRASKEYFLKNGDFGSYRKTNNHLVVFTPAIIDKTVLKYFDLVKIEYHVRNKIFQRGLKGPLRKILYKTAARLSPQWQELLKKRWAYNGIYILKKKPLNDNPN